MALDSPSATPSRTSNGMIPSPRKVALGSEGLSSPIMQPSLAIDKLQVWVENSGIKCMSWFYLIDNSLAQFKTFVRTLRNIVSFVHFRSEYRHLNLSDSFD
jgi:hypothetical protein